jgi:hypothetical protein
MGKGQLEYLTQQIILRNVVCSEKESDTYRSTERKLAFLILGSSISRCIGTGCREIRQHTLEQQKHSDNLTAKARKFMLASSINSVSVVCRYQH